MAQSNTERIMNLLIALLSARTPLTRGQIFEHNEGYQGKGDQAVTRMFERDKDLLRALGIPIRTKDVEGRQGTEPGYYVDPAEFELPSLEFSAAERAILGAAAHVWAQSVASKQTSGALLGLRAAGIATDPSRLMTLTPQLQGDPWLLIVRRALTDRRELWFTYRGAKRRIYPWQLKLERGQWYVVGFDLDRQEPRKFRLQRFMSEPTTHGKANAYLIPDDLPASLDEAADAPVIVALHDDVASELRRGAREVEVDQPLPQGFTAFGVRAQYLDLIIGEICSLGPQAIALEPAEIRQRVVAQLQVVSQ